MQQPQGWGSCNLAIFFLFFARYLCTRKSMIYCLILLSVLLLLNQRWKCIIWYSFIRCYIIISHHECLCLQNTTNYCSRRETTCLWISPCIPWRYLHTILMFVNVGLSFLGNKTIFIEESTSFFNSSAGYETPQRNGQCMMPHCLHS